MAPNSYFDSGDYTPPTAHTGGRSATLASLAQALESGFDLLPAATALNQDRLTYVVDTGAANAYVVALPVTLLAYAAGIRITMKAGNTNTGASTVNVDALGVKGIKRPDGSDLEANDIAGGGLAVLGYDGTNFQLLNSSAANADVAAHAALTATHGATGAIVGTTNVQTLTNKVLNSPTINTAALVAPNISGNSSLPGSGVLSSAGFLGIGMTPVNPLDITQSVDGPATASILNSNAGASAYTRFFVQNGVSNGALIQYGASFTTVGIARQNGTALGASGAGGLTLYTTANQPVYVGVNNAESARFTSDNGGELMIGATVANASEKLIVVQPDAAERCAHFRNSNATPGAATILVMDFSAASPDDNTAAYAVFSDSTSNRFIVYSDGDVQNHDNSYGAISARELKRDIADARTQSADIMALRLVNFRFKTDVTAGKNKEMLGLVAEEVEEISPGLVTTDAEGVKGIRYSILYMKAVGALQEAIARIESLEARAAALEAK